jgi:molybdate transport system permease protein
MSRTTELESSPPQLPPTPAPARGNTQPSSAHAETRAHVGSDLPFFTGMIILGGFYVVMIVVMLLADLQYASAPAILRALNSPEIRYSIKLSLISCSLTALLSLWVAVPLGYLMSRYRFPGQMMVDAIIDIPIVLPPLVVGLSLLILFQTPLGKAFEARFGQVTFAVPSVILAQFMVACAFAVRTMRTAFDQISRRQEHVALTLGCSKSQAFFLVVLPQARRGIITAATLAWARALGEFGPILLFSGSTRSRTEVLSTSVYLEFSVGNLEAAVALSLLMITISIAVLVALRYFGLERMWKTAE